MRADIVTGYPGAGAGAAPRSAAASCRSAATACGYPRDFLGNRYVYTSISPRARGLAVGVNLNPDKHCNFGCIYCEVNRTGASLTPALDLPLLLTELEQTLELAHCGRIRERPSYRGLDADLMALRHVALSGDGEPTLRPDFVEALEAILHLRARARFPFFPLVLMTNASCLDRPDVQQSLRLFTALDEIWVKLDAGTQTHMNRVNRPDCSLEKILNNILILARIRPIVIQSLFPAIAGQGPPPSEVDAFAQTLKGLKDAGGQIALVQIYSASPTASSSECGHLPLAALSAIARRVWEVAGLKAQVF